MDTYPDDAHIINIDSYINDSSSSLINPSGISGVEVRGTARQLHNYENIVARDHERAKGIVRVTIQKLEAYLDPYMREDVEQEVRPALSRFFSVSGTRKQDLADIREILTNYRKVATYLNRDEPITRAQRLNAWFKDVPLYQIRPRSNDCMVAYVLGGPICWPDWRIVPRSLRSRSVGSGWSGLGLFLAGGMAYGAGVLSHLRGELVEERHAEHILARGAMLFGGLAMIPSGLSYGVNQLRRFTSESGINLHEEHFAKSDRFRSSVVVHEATHLVLGTNDHAYEHQPRFRRLSTTQHMTNADSYAVFAEEVSRARKLFVLGLARLTTSAPRERAGPGCLDSAPLDLSGFLPGYAERGALRFCRCVGRA
ncbi:M35 family metallo-endopeptidase [Bradyrhizobium ottawaense]|uniref:M35 family metallo-endopeptidase n=1 Tax=Bradyrhizobium ottawaense TaxID=931866 RepID=UPI00384E26F0